jgi:hypothetical protein
MNNNRVFVGRPCIIATHEQGNSSGSKYKN